MKSQNVRVLLFSSFQLTAERSQKHDDVSLCKSLLGDARKDITIKLFPLNCNVQTIEYELLSSPLPIDRGALQMEIQSAVLSRERRADNTDLSILGDSGDGCSGG